MHSDEDVAARLLRQAGQLARVGGWELDLATGTFAWTTELYPMHDLEPGTPLTVEAVVELYEPAARTAIGDLFAGRVPGTWDTEVRLAAADRWLRLRGQTVCENGRPARLLGACQDVTDRHVAATPVAGDEYLARVLDTMTDAVICTDPDARIHHFNPAATRLFRWDPAAVAGRRLTELCDLICPRNDQPVPDPAAEAIRLGRDYALPEAVRLGADPGVAVSVAAALLRQADGAPAGAVIVGRDVTDLLASADRGRDMDRLQAVARLAGGVAHEFNNQLAGIMGFADILRGKLATDPRLGSYAGQIVTASRKAAELVRQLLAFSRQGRYRSDTIDVDDLLGELVALLQHSLDRRIRVRRRPPDCGAVCQGDRQQLQSALLHLALNAQEAMPAGGDLVFAATRTELDDTFCRQHPEVCPGPHVAIRVHDTGGGMPEAVRRHVFEPFFTTKPGSPSAGMSLAAVYGTMRSHGGLVTVDSHPDRGTCFTIYLPLAPRANGHAHPPGHRILVVDDESAAREAACRILGDRGYQVTACQDGTEAVDWCRRHPRDAALVLLDLTLPRLTGPDTFHQLRQVDDQARIIVCDGSAPDTGVRRVLEAGAVGFLRKPFTPGQLLTAVQRAFPTPD